MKHEFIKEIKTENSGGNVMLDIIKLKDGQVLIISDEVVCRYKKMQDYYDSECDYDSDCIELYQ